jgi:hypothetical protein
LTPTLTWSKTDVGGSYVDLYTGKLTISFKAAARSVVKVKLITAQGYETDRTINLYIGYSGENSLTKRRAIRTAIRSWANGFKIGGSIFAAAIRGTTGDVILAASKSNVSDVVLSTQGITGVNRVALDSPSNSAIRIDAAATELLKVGVISLNGLTD